MKHKTYCILVISLLFNLSLLCAQDIPVTDSIRNEMGGKSALSSLGRCRIYVTEGRDRKHCTIREIDTTVLVYEQEGSLHDMPIRNIEKILFENDKQVTLYFDDDNEPVLAGNQYNWSTPVPLPNQTQQRLQENDIIVTAIGDTIRCRITKETEWNIFYTENNVVKMLSKEFIQTYRSPGGWRQVMKEEIPDTTTINKDTLYQPKQETGSWNYVPGTKSETKNEMMDYEAQGRNDARIYYEGKGVYGGSVVTGIFFPFGWLPAILIAAIPPVHTDNFQNPNNHLLESNTTYLKGYKKEAHRKKAGKVLQGFATGVLLDIGLFVGLSSL